MVDDVDDSGTTLAFVTARLRACRPAALATFVVHRKRRVCHCAVLPAVWLPVCC